MLARMGSSFPAPEVVVYSAKVTKVNKRKKAQPRVLLITDKAIYNLMPGDYSKCRRRIDLESLGSVTYSTTSDEFVLHVPTEYDYRFKSADKETIADVLGRVFEEKTDCELVISKIDQSSLVTVTVGKDVASREDRLARYREMLLAAEDGDSDDEKAFAGASAYGADAASKATVVSPSDFTFLRVIGRGSFGKVMLVRCKLDDIVYAMKILKKDSIVKRHQVEHTRAERQILESLNHPFCMSMQYAFQTDTKLYFVLNFFRGGELFFHLKKQRKFTMIQSRFFVAEVGMALGHLHTLGIVYRDLKPENILLDHSGHVCVTDFGLSKDLGDDLQSYTFCGTPEYLAPEIVMSVGHTMAVDWWSLGILLYELTIGIPPFYSQNVNEMYRKIQTSPLFFPSSFKHLTLQFKACVSELLDRNPRYRLGGGVDDFEEIKRHPFFIGMDWEALYKKELEPPFKPDVKGGDDDVSLFDKQFTDEKVVDSYIAKDKVLTGADADKHFKDFGFAKDE
jgi:serine/threonine protein kinase